MPKRRRYISPRELKERRAWFKKNKPWLKSTGPKTAQGKARSAANGLYLGDSAKVETIINGVTHIGLLRALTVRRFLWCMVAEQDRIEGKPCWRLKDLMDDLRRLAEHLHRLAPEDKFARGVVEYFEEDGGV